MPPSSSPSHSQRAPIVNPQAEPFTAYVGSSSPNPGPSGWAAVIDAPGGTQRLLTGSAEMATCNQMGMWATFMALGEIPADALGVIYLDNTYVLDGLTTWRKGWARRRWRKRTGQPILNGAFWRILSASADAHPGVRFVRVKSENAGSSGLLAYRSAQAEAEKMRAGSEPVGGCGVILEDCAEEDAEANLAWLREGEIQEDAA